MKITDNRQYYLNAIAHMDSKKMNYCFGEDGALLTRNVCRACIYSIEEMQSIHIV